MRVIIAGIRRHEGLEFTNYELVKLAYQKSGFIATSIVSGNAIGVDQLGEKLAVELGLPIDSYSVTKEEWDQLGKSAGYLRNIKMAENADALVAIFDDDSKGTKHMIDIATKHGLQVFTFKID